MKTACVGGKQDYPFIWGLMDKLSIFGMRMFYEISDPNRQDDTNDDGNGHGDNGGNRYSIHIFYPRLACLTLSGSNPVRQ